MHANVYSQVDSVGDRWVIPVMCSTLVANHKAATFLLMTCLAAVVTSETSSMPTACIALRAVCLQVPWLLAHMTSLNTLVVISTIHRYVSKALCVLLLNSELCLQQPWYNGLEGKAFSHLQHFHNHAIFLRQANQNRQDHFCFLTFTANSHQVCHQVFRSC